MACRAVKVAELLRSFVPHFSKWEYHGEIFWGYSYKEKNIIIIMIIVIIILTTAEIICILILSYI